MPKHTAPHRPLERHDVTIRAASRPRNIENGQSDVIERAEPTGRNSTFADVETPSLFQL
jgi:hypothetical protein